MPIIKIIFGLLTIICGLALSAAGICVTGGIIAALIAHFTTGVITVSAGACVTFAIKSAIAAAVALVSYFGCAMVVACAD